MMTLSRRHALYLAAALPAAMRLANAQAYPTRPVRIISGFPPGGVNDTYARLIGQWLSEHLGQQFFVENRPGAGGNIAAETLVRAAPDGYTLLLATSADAWNATLYDNLKFNFVRGVAPVAPISRAPGVLVVHPSLPSQSIPELITYAKSNPGKIPVSSAGIGSATRIAVLPDLPALAEFLPGYEASIFVGIVAPHNTPAEITGKLNQEINLALADARITRRIAELGDTPLSLSSSEFAKLIADETEKWGNVIRAAHVKAE